MILYLKKIKYFLKNNKFIGHYFLIIKLLINGKIILNFFFSSKFPNIGKFKTKINIFDFEEIKILDNENYDHPNLQSFRSLELDKINLFLNSSNKLLKKFLSKTLNIKVINFVDLKKKKFNKKNNNVLITDELISLKDKNKIDLNKMSLIFTKKNSNFINAKYFRYKYEQGRIFPDSNKYKNYYKLFSKKKININKNNLNKLSGFSTLKSLDIYPFDLAYESILPYVDEFFLGIDSSCFNTRYERILNSFLKKTKFRKKIRLEFFNFNSETANNLKVRGRWIVDANNRLLNKCKGNYCLYVQADEIFPNISKKKFNKIFISQPDEIYFDYLHYVFNLETIIEPKKSAYSEAIRIFKKDIYACCHDGFSFHNLSPYRPKSVRSNLTIKHLSYVYKFNKKINEHFTKKSGVFKNRSKKYFLNNYIVPKKVKNIKNDLKYLKHLDSYKLVN